MMHGSNGILMLTCIKLLKKINLIVMIVKITGQHQQRIQFSGLLFLPLWNVLQILRKKGLISSLLKVFAIFELHLSYKEGNLDVVSLRCINCKRETGLFLKNNTFDETFTKFVLNAILHHVSMSWIISSKKEMDY